MLMHIFLQKVNYLCSAGLENDVVHRFHIANMHVQIIIQSLISKSLSIVTLKNVDF